MIDFGDRDITEVLAFDAANGKFHDLLSDD